MSLPVKARHLPHVTCACGSPMIECPRCAAREEPTYTLICSNPKCGEVDTSKKKRVRPRISRSVKLDSKKRTAGQCVKCRLGSPQLLSGTLCAKHKADGKIRRDRMEARRAVSSPERAVSSATAAEGES